MEQKIKINISRETYTVLVKDCEDFLFIDEENGKKKINNFLNTLIVRYYELFSLLDEKLNKELREVLQNENKDSILLTNQTHYIKTVLLKHNNGFSNPKKSCFVPINIKPTSVSKHVFDFINSQLIKNETVSSYYRRLFDSYCKNTQDARERIIFSPLVKTISSAITNKNIVFIGTTHTSPIKSGSIYSLSTSKDMLFNYLLFKDLSTNNFWTLRLARITNIKSLNDHHTLSDMDEQIFKRQIETGPQYKIDNVHNAEIKVYLTKPGLKLFRQIYLYRPEVIRTETPNIFVFNCSFFQVLQYFKRFGNDAVIFEPFELYEQMRNHYYFSNKTYKSYDKLIKNIEQKRNNIHLDEL